MAVQPHYAYLLTGFACFALAVVAYQQGGGARAVSGWPWLSAAAGLGGLTEWAGMLAFSRPWLPMQGPIRLSLSAVALLCLIGFGAAAHSFRRSGIRAWRLLLIAAPAVLICFTQIGPAALYGRVLLWLLAGLVAGSVFWRAADHERYPAPRIRIGVGSALFCYGALAGLRSLAPIQPAAAGTDPAAAVLQVLHLAAAACAAVGLQMYARRHERPAARGGEIERKTTH